MNGVHVELTFFISYEMFYVNTKRVRGHFFCTPAEPARRVEWEFLLCNIKFYNKNNM